MPLKKGCEKDVAPIRNFLSREHVPKVWQLFSNVETTVHLRLVLTRWCVCTLSSLQTSVNYELTMSLLERWGSAEPLRADTAPEPDPHPPVRNPSRFSRQAHAQAAPPPASTGALNVQISDMRTSMDELRRMVDEQARVIQELQEAGIVQQEVIESQRELMMALRTQQTSQQGEMDKLKLEVRELRGDVQEEKKVRRSMSVGSVGASVSNGPVLAMPQKATPEFWDSTPPQMR